MPSRPRPTVPGAPSRAQRGPSSRRLVRPASSAVTVALLTVLLAGLLGAAPASAHARFTGSDPAEGARLDQLPATVVLSYSEDVAPQFVETAAIAPDGTTLPTTASAAGRDVTVRLAGAPPGAEADQAGTWQVVARVVSVDGHPVEHTTTFTVTPSAGAAEETGAAAGGGDEPEAEPAADPDAEPAAEPADDPVPPVTAPAASPADGLPRWAAVLGAGVLVVAAAAALLVQLRRRPPAG